MLYSKLIPVAATLLATVVPDVTAVAVNPIGLREVDKDVAKSRIFSESSTKLVPFTNDKLFSARRSKRQQESEYALQTSDTWYWSLNGASVPNAMLKSSFHSQATGKTAEHGKSVAIERLMDHFEDLSCSDDGLSMHFKTRQGYEAAKSHWNWVNEESSRYIVMVTNSDKCNGHRQPWKVSDLETDSGALKITAKGSAVDFQDAFPVSTLRLAGNVANSQNAARGLDKRISVDKKLSIPLAHDFSATIFDEKVSDNLDVSLKCAGCNTTGEINIDVSATLDLFKSPPFDVSVTVTPSGISASVGLDLEVTGTLNTALDKTVTFINVPLPGGIHIPVVGGIGPFIQVDGVAEITNVTASVDLHMGTITMSIDDNSKAVLDITDSKKDQLNGFTPKFTTQGPSINAGVSVSGTVEIDIALGFDAEILGKGIGAGLSLAAPKLDAHAGINANGCPGVEFDAELGAQLNAFGGVGKIADVAAKSTISIIGTSTQIFSTCLTDFPGFSASATTTSSAATTAASTSFATTAPFANGTTTSN